jgi:hypothetical protein
MSEIQNKKELQEKKMQNILQMLKEEKKIYTLIVKINNQIEGKMCSYRYEYGSLTVTMVPHGDNYPRTYFDVKDVVKVIPKPQLRKKFNNQKQYELILPPSNESEFIYKKKTISESRDLYWGINTQNYIKIFIHDKNNESGCYGDIFKLTMTDGSVVKIKGLYFSNSTSLNEKMDFHVMECSDYTSIIYYSLENIKNILQQYFPNMHIINGDWGVTHYVIVEKD